MIHDVPRYGIDTLYQGIDTVHVRCILFYEPHMCDMYDTYYPYPLVLYTQKLKKIVGHIKVFSTTMVLTRPSTHRAFEFAGCTGPCCDPRGRHIVTTRSKPLPPRSFIAFILVVNRVCRTKHFLPQEVLRRIFELGASVEYIVVKRAPPPTEIMGTGLRIRDQQSELGLQGLSLNAPI